MKRLIIMICAALVLLSGCKSTPERYSAVYTDVFDTVTEFTAYCGSQQEFDKLSEAAHAELLRLHRIFDIYNSYDGVTNAYTLNVNSGGFPSEPIDIDESMLFYILTDSSPELLEVITMAKEWYDLTGGRLNIAMGSVLSLWHDCREAGILPDADELLERAKHCDFDDVVIENGCVFLNDPELSFDFGALAKGYAAEKTAQLLESMGDCSFALSVGGNVVIRGEKPTGKWEIGVENPDGGILAVVKISDVAIVTSGDYQRYFEVDGVRYHHIIDSETLYPASLWRSVTIICDDSGTADALSTALFCMPLEEGKELLKKFDAEALWVGIDGEITRSEGFGSYEG